MLGIYILYSFVLHLEYRCFDRDFTIVSRIQVKTHGKCYIGSFSFHVDESQYYYIDINPILGRKYITYIGVKIYKDTLS